jgi:hypothetical protein
VLHRFKAIAFFDPIPSAILQKMRREIWGSAYWKFIFQALKHHSVS